MAFALHLNFLPGGPMPMAGHNKHSAPAPDAEGRLALEWDLGNDGRPFACWMRARD